MDNFYTRKDISENTVEFTITIPKDSFNKSYKAVLEQELSNTKLDGFRKGKVPTDLIEPEMKNTVKIQTFEKMVPMYLTTALQKENLSPIAPPTYKSFPDFSKDEELVLVVEIQIMPEFKLGDMKKIKVKKEKYEVSEKELGDALENVFEGNKTKAKKMDDAWANEIAKLMKIDNIKTLEDLKKYVKDLLEKQKDLYEQRRQEDDAFAQAIALSKIEIPQAAIDYEAHEREHSFLHDMDHDDQKVEKFLEANNISMEKMKELWQKDAKDALESDVFLKLYAKEKGIKVDEKVLIEKIETIKKGAPEDTDPTIYENEEWREYVRRITEKELAFKTFIEQILGTK